MILMKPESTLDSVPVFSVGNMLNKHQYLFLGHVLWVLHSEVRWQVFGLNEVTGAICEAPKWNMPLSISRS